MSEIVLRERKPEGIALYWHGVIKSDNKAVLKIDNNTFVIAMSTNYSTKANEKAAVATMYYKGRKNKKKKGSRSPFAKDWLVNSKCNPLIFPNCRVTTSIYPTKATTTARISVLGTN